MESKNVEVLREAAMPFFEDGNISSMTKENLVKSLAPIRNFLDHAAGPNRSVLRAKLATMLDELEANTKLYETKNRDLFLRLVRQVGHFVALVAESLKISIALEDPDDAPMSPFMHQVETEIRDLEEQHAEKDREIQLLKKELEATRAKLDEKENQLSDAASSISRVRENLNALHKKKVADLKTQLNEAREECEKQKRRNADSEQEMDEVLSERENLQRELSAIKALFNDFTVLAKV